MSGLVAVVSTARDGTVEDDDLKRLVECYEAVRGPSSSWMARGGTRVLAARLEPAGGTRIRAEATWPVTVGAPHGPADGRPGSAAWLRGVEGQFALVTYDARTGEVVVANDPLGMTGVYCADRAGLVYVSTSALALARLLNASADQLALQSFLLTGYHFGTGTHWRGVERLDPGQVVRFGPAGRSRDHYWRPQVLADVRRLPFAKAVDQCLEVTVETFRSHLAGGPATWADLTGGYDSRLLTLLLRRADVDFRVNTRHTTDPTEVAVADRIVAATGWSWIHPSLPDEWDRVLPTFLPASLGWGDAHLEVLQLSRVLWVHRLLARTSPFLLSAGGGEHLQFAAWKSEFAAAGRSNRVNLDNWIDMRMLKPIEAGVLAGNPLREVREDMRVRLTRWIAPYSAELNTTQLDLLYAYKATGHFGAYRSADDGWLKAQLPFYFRHVFETVFSTDHRHRNGHRLMRHMIERLDPVVAALPTTRGGPAQPWRVTNAHRFVPYFARLARKAVTKVSHRALGRSLLLQHVGYPWAAQANRSVLDQLSAELTFRPDALRSAELYRGDALCRLVAAAQRPGFTHDALLGRIITVELALAAVDGRVEVERR